MNGQQLDQIIQTINSLPSAFVSRNADLATSVCSGGDIDVTVDAERIEEAERIVVQMLGEPQYITSRSYVRGYFYPDFQLDLILGHDWHGATFLAPSMFSQATYINQDGLRQLDLPHEALVCWLTSLLWGGFFKEKYRPLVSRAVDERADEFQDALVHALGRPWGHRLFQAAAHGRLEQSAQWVRQVRRAAWLQSFRRDGRGTLRRWLAFWLAEVRLRMAPPTPWVVVLGADGSGKTTVIEGLAQRVERERLFSRVTRGHWRPGLGQRGGREGLSSPVTDPHAQPPRGWWSSLAKVVVLVLDWQIGFRLRFNDARARNHLVVFDRHFVDLLIDPRRYRYGAPRVFALLAALLVPRPNLWIVLDAPTAVLQSRKQEVPPHETERQRKGYLALARRMGNAHVIDATQPVDRIVDQIYSQLVEVVTQQTRRRLGRKRP